MAVLLIGSTESGKSTLGNFLLDPNNSTVIFDVATDNLSRTTHTKAVTASVMFYDNERFLNPIAIRMQKKLTVIDTPGLNESPEKDNEHMINVVEELQKQKRIQAVIFVTKFNAKIDQQYRDTIKYYSRLRPSLFNHNSIIAMTDYATDECSIKKRQRQKIDDAKMISNVKKEIMECSGMGYEPMVFTLDCLPYPGDHKEIAKANDIRNSILSHIFSRSSFSTRNIKIVTTKTKSILDEGEKFIKQYEGNARLKQVDKELETVQKQQITSSIVREVQKLKEDLKEMDSADPIKAVLLIGSTGSGKSTLGNFLLDPDNLQAEEIFAVGTDNLLKTAHTKVVTADVTFYDRYQEEGDTTHDINEHTKTGASDTNSVVPKSTDSDQRGGYNAYYAEDIPRAAAVMVTKLGEQLSQVLTQRPIPSIRRSLTLIDTPGLNDGSQKDFEHMINIVEELQKQKRIKAVIFVVKFDTKIDLQYRETIKYYSRLQPSLFSQNSIIVMTDYPTDERSIRKRKHQKIDDAKMISNVKQEIIECSGIFYEPIVFALDCLPLPGDREEIAKAKKIRSSILSCIFSQRSIITKDILVAKTKSILDEDEKFIKQYEGEIEGYNARLKQEINSYQMKQKLAEKELQEKYSEFEYMKRIESLEKYIEEKQYLITMHNSQVMTLEQARSRLHNYFPSTPHSH